MEVLCGDVPIQKEMKASVKTIGLLICLMQLKTLNGLDYFI